jgi:hypothetical protein
MNESLIGIRPFTVPEVIKDASLDSKYVSVHGILYNGEGCKPGEHLLLPRMGPFDGVGPIPMPENLDRRNCLLIDEPGLESQLLGWGAMGSFLWKWDAVIAGKLSRSTRSEHQVRVFSLCFLMVQDWMDIGRGAYSHNMRIGVFPPSRLSDINQSTVGMRHGLPTIEILSQLG